ncbi:MAG: class I adenylate-forming enzyme family protein [Dehalococcoidia bacterium]|nr:class I adenylate-forming enzyme family protein [Dehalococcoidia bacterium]MDD5493982.1 class I adenylate-forming enzyme family protein [Dehalococcoidia bacterium]
MNDLLAELSSPAQPYTGGTMADVVEQSATSRPYRGMLYYHGDKTSYHDFIALSSALSAGLVSLGVRPGDHVAVMLPNSPQMILSIHAAWKAGAVVLPIDIMCREEGLVQAVNGVFASVIIVAGHFYDMVKRIQQRTGIRVIIVTDMEEFLTFPQKIFDGHPGKAVNGCNPAVKPGDLWFKRLLSMYQDAKRPSVHVWPSHPAVTFFNAGNADYGGFVRILHHDLMNTAQQMRVWLGPVLDEWEDRFLLSAPLSSVFGFVNAWGTAMVNHSSCVLVSGTNDLTGVLKSIHKYKVAFILDNAEFFRGIINHPLVQSGRMKFKGLGAGIISSPGLAVEERSYFESLTGARLLECY